MDEITFLKCFTLLEKQTWLLVAEKKECADPTGKFNVVHAEDKGINTVEECAETCHGTSSMFSFGTNDFEDNRCNHIGCRCLCEVSASEDGTCQEVTRNGYRLYKFRRFGKNNII